MCYFIHSSGWVIRKAQPQAALLPVLLLVSSFQGHVWSVAEDSPSSTFLLGTSTLITGSLQAFRPLG